MQKAFETIKQLVADFKAQESAYLSPSYQESQIRQDFIDKFFTALGWDVTHTIQKNPYQQEVHIENKVHMAGSQRRADYAFFLAPNFRDPKFFVEAKKPSRNLANPDDYYQTIRYGWNANTPIAILIDFEEFHILDCRYKPTIKDVMNQKIERFHYSDYINEEKFSRIYWLFSHEAVAGGSLEKRVAELPKLRGKATKGGYQPVDEAFLEELDKYREVLAKAFKKSNHNLQSEELTEAVQRTIDRLVFIRFLEDKQIEEPEIINLRSKKSAWKGFLALCKQLDPKYNGLVFKPHIIIDSEDFNSPDDEEFAHICDELADPSSPYNFDQIPISILGSIYERFLGKVVHSTEKRVTVEEKPEVRKAGGVYYTPEYIVRYIVKETVGKLIEDKKPEEIAKMAFADIACGSGSFLIEVYNQLLEYHIRYYSANSKKQKESDVFERDGKLHLTLKKKKDILLKNIYGVDLDFQATEVTQLSLYLKLLEDVTMHDAHQFGMFKETILPDLRNNIINGNSLIGRDIIENSLFPNVDTEKLKPMNFDDAFTNIMKRGGFDAIIGNPPYVRIQRISNEEAKYIFKVYKTPTSKTDLSLLFLERSLNLITKYGISGFICTSQWINTDYGQKMRALLAKGHIYSLIDFGSLPVFTTADTYPAIVILTRSINTEFEYSRILAKKQLNLEGISNHARQIIKHSTLSEKSWSFGTFDLERFLNSKGLPWKELSTYGGAYIGALTGMDEAFVIDIKTINELKLERTLLLPYAYRGNEIFRYSNVDPQAFIIYPYTEGKNGDPKLIEEKVLQNKYPNIYLYLKKNKDKLKKRKDSRKFYATGSLWYRFLRPGSFRYIHPEKLLIKGIDIKSNVASLKQRSAFNGANCPAIILENINKLEIPFILAILNSRLITLFLNSICPAKLGGYRRYNANNINRIPIRTINFNDPKDKCRHDHIVKLVEQMLDAKDKLSKAKIEAETNRLEMQCQTLDRQIDEAVYELYGLTEEEIRIVEVE